MSHRSPAAREHKTPRRPQKDERGPFGAASADCVIAIGRAIYLRIQPNSSLSRRFSPLSTGHFLPPATAGTIAVAPSMTLPATSMDMHFTANFMDHSPEQLAP